MRLFLSRPKFKRHDFNTKRGVRCPMLHRDGTSDWNTVMSALEQDEYHLNELGLKPGDVAVDVGSHIGGVSVLLATLGLKVYSVEALPENAHLQKKNLKLNKLDDKVVVMNRAIARRSGEKVKLYYGDTSEAQGKHHEFIGTSANFNHFFGKGRSVSVPTVSLADIFKENRIERARLVKIDVEGAEWEALAEVPDEVLSRIDLLIGEWHPFGGNTSRKDLLKLLRGKFEDASERYGVPTNDFAFVRK